MEAFLAKVVEEFKNPWVIFGFAGQLIFGCRFLVQWICSERKGESHIPLVFWYLSLAGGVVLLSYAIHKQDPVFIFGQSTGVIVYVRNLMLIAKKKKIDRNTPPDPQHKPQ